MTWCRTCSGMLGWASASACVLLLVGVAACQEVEEEVLGVRPLTLFGTLDTGHPYRIEIVRRPRPPGSVVEVQVFVDAEQVTWDAGGLAPGAYIDMSPDPGTPGLAAGLLRPNGRDESLSRGESMLFEFREPPSLPPGTASLGFGLFYIRVDGRSPRWPVVSFDTTRIPTAPR